MTVARIPPVTSNLCLALLACPVLAAADTVIKATLIGIMAAIVMLTSSALAGVLRARLAPASALACGLLASAAVVSLLQLLVQAWLYDLGNALFVFLPLLAVNPGSLGPWLASTEPLRLRQAARHAATLLLCLLVLAVAREVVGRGAVLSDAALLPGVGQGQWTLTLFRLDMGFLLALLAPGAFISLGLALAARNWLRQRQATGQS